MNDNIVYKVISSKDRRGSNMAIYRCLAKKDCGKFNIADFFRKHPVLKPYFPQYKKGAIVKAVSGTPGIFCFQTVENAKRFVKLELLGCKLRNYLIVRVRGIGDKHYPKPYHILTGCGSIPTNLLDQRHYYNDTIPGSVCYPAVEVLE